MRTVVVFNQPAMGQPDPVLGLRLLQAFLRRCQALGDLVAIVLYNGGVTLVCEGSPVLAELTLLHEAGVEILPCGTCLEALGMWDRVRVSQPSNMDEIVKTLAGAEKVITL